MALKDKMPDLSAMSEKEMEAWAASLSEDEMMEFMEYLAGRSGATQGLTRDTTGLDLKAIDETKVKVDGPGYIPFGEESKAKQPAPPPAPAVAKQPAPPPQPPRPEPRPQRSDPPWDVEQPPARTVRLEEAPPARVSVTPPKPPAQPPRVEQTPPARPSAQPPRARVEPPTPAQPPSTRIEPTPSPVQQPLIPATPPPKPPVPAADTSTLAWLESLSSQEEDNLFNLELSSLMTGQSAGSAPAPENPMNWLEDLSRGGAEAPALELLADDEVDLGSEKIDPFAAGVDSVSWLDTLAERAGADPDELTTTIRFNIPTTAPDAVEALSYTPYDYESSTDRPTSPPVTDPAAFLSTLAGEAGYNESGVRAVEIDPLSAEAIRQAIADGSVSEEQMRHFLAQQEQDAAVEGVLIDFTGDDDELVPDIPDWLRDMQPTQKASPAAPTQPLESIFDALPEAPEAIPMPDWLTDDASTGAAAIEDIFDQTPVSAFVMTADVVAPAIEIDPRDPWVEALEAEHTYGAPDLAQEPDWYITNTHDPERFAALDARFGVRQGKTEDVPLAQGSLPSESSLPFGQEQPIPMWIDMRLIGLVEAAPPPPAAAPTPALLPEDSGWLSEIETPEDVPDWLKDTFSDPEPEELFVPPEPVIFAPPPPVVQQPPTPRPVAPPRPVELAPAPVLDEDVMAVLQGARDLEQAGDIEASLNEYQALIRANRGVDEVVEDLSSLVKSYRTVPAVYRVLGDALMRQGKLQAALNTYREALNQL